MESWIHINTLIKHKQINDQTLDLSRNAIIHIFFSIPRLYHGRVQKHNNNEKYEHIVHPRMGERAREANCGDENTELCIWKCGATRFE